MDRTFEEIMSEINDGLTGDTDRDLKYLIGKAAEYREHPYAKEITRAIGRIQYRLLPDEIRSNLEDKTSEDMEVLRKKLKRADYHIVRKEYEEAEAVLVPLVRDIEEAGLFKDDTVSEYHVFDDLFEEMIFLELQHPAKKVRRVPYPYHEIYLRCGSLMIDMGRYDEAQNAFEKALHWNPVSSWIWLEYAETFKYRGMTEQVINCTKKLFPYVYQPKLIAKCYRNFGFCLIEEQKYTDAAVCYYMSLIYDSESSQAEEELRYIQQTAGFDPEPPEKNDILRVCRTYGIPQGPNPDLLAMAYTAGKMMMEKNDYQSARHFLEIAYDLMPADEIRTLLDQMEMN